MKNLFYFFTFLLIIALSSCNEDNDVTSVEPSDLLLGIWNVTSITSMECFNSFENGTVIFGDDGCTDFNGELFCNISTMEFKQDGSVHIIAILTIDGQQEELEESKGTYELSDLNDELLTLCIEGSCDDGELVLSESSLEWEGSQPNCADVIVRAFK